jgi:hypothetical protein
MIPALLTPFVLAGLFERLRQAKSRLAVLTLAAILCGALNAALTANHSRTIVNELGLVSSDPDRTDEVDYSQNSNKDHYPVCRFLYNSLGYRDIEPSFSPKGSIRRVLVVGDSFVWGDGIPSNDETLAYRLRAELGSRAPGRYSVMSAAYPGLGLYGYDRFVDTIAPRFDPDIVVIGYLGLSDHDPFDTQAIADHWPDSWLLRDLVLNIGAAQYLHEAAAVHGRALWEAPGNAAAFAALREHFARQAAARGYRLIFLSYFGVPAPLPAPIEALELPSELGYPGQGNEFWYGKDCHPKPKLDALLGQRVAAAILAGDAATRPLR